MKMVINDTRKIYSLQEEFTSMFPYLKIEFFSASHKPNEGSSKNLIKQNNITLGECRTKHVNGAISIDPQMAVTDLEQQFSSKYGLNIQVFRKCGRIWLETTITDKWTLEEQNWHGEMLSKHVNEKDIS